MDNKKDIFNLKKEYENPYDLPLNYFGSLNDDILTKIKQEKVVEPTKVFQLNFLVKAAAAIAIVLCGYFFVELRYSSLSIDYTELSLSIDDYMSEEDELFSTFIDNDQEISYNYEFVDNNINDYLENDIY